MDQWAAGSTGWHGPIFGPRTVPGPSDRHGGLFRHGPVARRAKRARARSGRAWPGLGPGRAVLARCSSLIAHSRVHDYTRVRRVNEEELATSQNQRNQNHFVSLASTYAKTYSLRLKISVACRSNLSLTRSIININNICISK